jgi:hypothetical protein
MRNALPALVAAALISPAFGADTKSSGNAVDAALAQAKKDKKLVAIVVYQFG